MKRRTLLTSPLVLLASPAQGASRQLEFGTSRVTLDIAGEASAAFTDLVERWVAQSGAAVQTYYGRFPVPEAVIRIAAGNGEGVGGGQTFPGDIPLIRARVGRDSTETDLLRKDWVMVHEMVHLAFPWMNRKHNWMAEGLAVYVESIARLQAGHITAAQVWGDFVHMMPRGLPAAGDGGYDVTVNWGRTYWGGAIFCLLADLAIRKATGNALGLQHALRAINATRDFRREWDFTETLKVGDEATGTNVLASQYEAMRIDAVTPDLDSLWRSLGVKADGAIVGFDDNAPLAAARRAIETPL